MTVSWSREILELKGRMTAPHGIADKNGHGRDIFGSVALSGAENRLAV